MSSFGSYLRELRERRGLSLDQVARMTRIASSYLAALEAEDLGRLPANVFTKGFIRAYCQAMGEPPDEAIARYAVLTGAPPSATAAAMPTPGARAEAGRGRSTVLVSFVLLIVLGLALFAVTLVLQAGREGGSERRPVEAGPSNPVPAPAAAVTERSAETVSQRPVPPAGDAQPAPPVEPPVPAAPSLATPAPQGLTTPPSPGVAPASPAIAPAPSPGNSAIAGSVTSPYRLVARVSEVTWIRVRMEDGRATEETIPAGEIREWVSNAPFVLTVGNAGGVSLELNGRTLPPLGARGTVIPRLVIPPQQ